MESPAIVAEMRMETGCAATDIYRANRNHTIMDMVPAVPIVESHGSGAEAALSALIKKLAYMEQGRYEEK